MNGNPHPAPVQVRFKQEASGAIGVYLAGIKINGAAEVDIVQVKSLTWEAHERPIDYEPLPVGVMHRTAAQHIADDLATLGIVGTLTETIAMEVARDAYRKAQAEATGPTA